LPYRRVLGARLGICHPERSEGSLPKAAQLLQCPLRVGRQILRCAPQDTGSRICGLPAEILRFAQDGTFWRLVDSFGVAACPSLATPGLPRGHLLRITDSRLYANMVHQYI